MTSEQRSVLTVRAVAILHSCMALAGAYFIAMTADIGFAGFDDDLSETPYIAHFFWSFVSVNVALVAGLGSSSWLLWTLRRSGLWLLCAVLGAELVYWIALGFLWTRPDGISAAAASGIGNMGLAPQMFLGYPLTGLILIAVLGGFGVWRRAFSARPAIAAH